MFAGDVSRDWSGGVKAGESGWDALGIDECGSCRNIGSPVRNARFTVSVLRLTAGDDNDEELYRRCCGMDVHKNSIVVYVSDRG